MQELVVLPGRKLERRLEGNVGHVPERLAAVVVLGKVIPEGGDVAAHGLMGQQGDKIEVFGHGNSFLTKVSGLKRMPNSLALPFIFQ